MILPAAITERYVAPFCRLRDSLKSEIICDMEFAVIGETSWQTRVFVENIIRIMARKKMTRLEFARRLGVRPSYVTKALSGRENLTVKTMESMAAAVGYEVVFGLRRLPGGNAMREENAATVKKYIEKGM